MEATVFSTMMANIGSITSKCQKIKEAQVLGQSILQYAPKSNAVTDYTAFVDELIR